MTNQMRQRLIGILVVIAVLAIFLPVFFHSTLQPIKVTKQMPTEPASPQVVLQLPGEQGERIISPDDDQKALPVTEKDPDFKAIAHKSTVLPVNQDPDHTAIAEKVPMKHVAAYHPSSKVVVKVIKKKKKVAHHRREDITPPPLASTRVIHRYEDLHKNIENPQAWVLRVATFHDTLNVNRLVKRLRVSHFDAYYKVSKDAAGKDLYRVYVGPEIKMSNAKKVKDKIYHQFHMKGLIQKYKL